MRDIDSPINGIIYKTTNTVNGKWYIGMDERDNPDYLGSGKVLSRAVAKYGRNVFQKEVLARANTRRKLAELERKFIAETGAVTDPMSYNIAEGGYGGSTWHKGPERELVIEKLRKAHTGKKKTEEHKHKISLSKIGKKQSRETCERKRIIGKQRFAEGKIQMPQGKNWTGLHHTTESKLKISNSKKGTVRNDLRKVTNDVLGEILSEIKAGVSITAVAKKHGLARKTVYAYIKDYR